MALGRVASRTLSSGRVVSGKDLKRRAKKQNAIRANRDASESALLFGNTRQGQDAWKTATRGGTRPLSKDERMMMNREHRQTGSALRQELNTARENMRNATNKEDKMRYQQQMRDIGAEMRQHTASNPSGVREVNIGAMDRVKAAGTAVGQYYFGGSGKQTAARIGATAGAIIGVPLAVDAAENAINSGSSRLPGM